MHADDTNDYYDLVVDKLGGLLRNVYPSDYDAVLKTFSKSLAMVKIYQSPARDCSLMKNIPNTPENHQLIHNIRLSGFKLTKRYRGPRRATLAGRMTCLKKDATSFAVYVNPIRR